LMVSPSGEVLLLCLSKEEVPKKKRPTEYVALRVP
jgi:hypothetical protein